MPTRLLLVRHGDSHHRRDGSTGGPRSCRGLTDEGRQQAAKLCGRLRRDGSFNSPVHVYSSIVPRAIETARIIAEAFDGVPVREDCDLCSFHTPPEADAVPWAKFRANHARVGGGVFLPFEAGNEAWAELVARTGRGLSRLVQEHRNETVIVVAHAQTVESSFIVFGGQPLFRAFDLRVSPTSVTEWTTDEDTMAWSPVRWTLARFNDAAHLEFS